METRQIISSPAPAAVLSDDRHTLRVPSAHWAAVHKNFSANAVVPVGVVCEVAVPKSLYNRRVYCDFKGEDQNTTSQFILGTIEFFLAGHPVLTLPFDTHSRVGDKFFGIRLCTAYEASPAGHHLISWTPLGQPLAGPIYLAPFVGRLACDRIAVVARAGNADTASITTALLACYSEGETD